MQIKLKGIHSDNCNTERVCRNRHTLSASTNTRITSCILPYEAHILNTNNHSIYLPNNGAGDVYHR